MRYLNGSDEELIVRGGLTFQRILVVKCGQSNSTTLGLVSALTDQTWAASYADVPFTARQGDNANPPNDTDYPLQSLDSLTYLALDRLGFEASMMRDLSRSVPAGFACALFGYSSTSSLNWDPTGTYPSTEPTNLYTQFIAFIRASMTSTECGRVVFVWEQGENDAGGLTTATAYGTWLATFRTALASEFGSLFLGFVLGKLNLAYDGGAYTTELRASQVAFVAAVPSAVLVDQDSVVTPQYDGVHYTADGYIALGHLFSVGVATALGIRIDPKAQFTSVISARQVTFTDTSYAPGSTVTGWLWDFGDSTTSTSQNPVHTYSADGTFNVTLTVTNALTDTDVTVATPVTVTLGLSGVTRDTLSNYYFPATDAEWTLFLTAVGLSALGNPYEIWNWQMASGNMVGANSLLTLTAAGTPTYQQATSGFTRYCVKTATGGAHRFAAASGVGPSPATTDQLWIHFGRVIGTPAGARTWAGISDGASHTFQANVDNVPRGSMTCNGVTTNGTLSPSTLAIGPMTLQYDRTNSRAEITYTTEKIVGTYSAAVTDGRKGWGANGGTGHASEVVYSVLYTGVGARMSAANLKALLLAMGTPSISWS